MRNVKPRQSFEAYLYSQKLIRVDEQLEPITASAIDEQLKQLVEFSRLYRHYQNLYLAKRKKGEFAKDEQHYMMKYQEKIDNLLKSIHL